MAMQQHKEGTGACPVTIIEYSNSKFEINVAEVTRIFAQESIKDAPVILMSVIGDPATGKSFLLNMIMKYMFEHGTSRREQWEKEKIKMLNGFPWIHKEFQTCARISIWPEPFWLKCGTGKAAFFLIDSEGIFDEEMPPDSAAAIAAITTLLSHIQVYNVQSNIHEVTLETLANFLQRGLAAFGAKQEPICQRIVYLVRDWIGRKKFSYGGEDGGRYIQEKLQLHESLSESEVSRRQFLERVYKETSCFLMPHPGDELAELEDVDQTLLSDFEIELKPKFLKAFEGLVQYLIRPMIAEPEAHSNKCLTGGAWLELFMVNVACFTEGKILAVMSEKRTSAEKNNTQILKKYMEEFSEQLEKENGAEEGKIDDLLTETRKNFESKIEGDVPMRTRFLNALSEKMKDKVRLAVVDSEVKKASVKASDINTCETALNKAKLLFISRMEEDSRFFDAILSQREFAQAKKEASDFFDMQVGSLNTVCGPYYQELMALFQKSGKILEEKIELAEQAKKETELRAKKAIHCACKQYRQLRDQKYGNTTYPIPKDELHKSHSEWLEAAKELYERETSQCKIQHEEHISQIEDYCTNLFEGTLEHFRKISKQYEERRMTDVEKIKSDIIGEYRERFLEKLVPPTTVINSLFRSSTTRNMTVQLSKTESEALKQECFDEIEKIYQQSKSYQERVKHEMEVQVKSITDEYIMDMIMEVFTKGESLPDAHQRVATTVLNEAAKNNTVEHSPLVERLQQNLEDKYWMIERLQNKREYALRDFVHECERKDLKPCGPRAEKIIDVMFKKWFSDMPLLPAEICKKWVLRGFEASCKAQKQKKSGWFGYGRKK